MRNLFSIGMLTLLLCSVQTSAGDKDKDDGRGGHYPDYDHFYRLDCRYHNVERNPGVNFCYASAVYQLWDGEFRHVQLGVGCDNQTLFNDRARIQVETTLDRLSPLRAATPGVEVFPQGQLNIEGTYTSELDISYGRFLGLCYVHKMKHKEIVAAIALATDEEPSQR